MKNRPAKIHSALLAGAVLGTQLVTSSLRAEETNTLEIIKQLQRRVEELEQKVKTLEAPKPPQQGTTDAQSKQRIEELDQQVKILKRNRELDAEAAQAKAKEAPRITLGEQGFSFSSADTNFVVQLKGVVQVDSRTFFHDAGIVGNDTLLLRRARPILQGTVYRDFDFLFVPDFGGTSGPQIFDAYVNYRYSPELQVQAGKFKVPVGLEELQSDAYTFFNERGLPTTLAPNRDIGFELHGDLFGGTVSYAAGIFNGVGDNRSSSNADLEDDKAFAGRIFLQPFKQSSMTALKGLGVGLAGSYEDLQKTNTANTTALPNYTTDGQQQFFAFTNSTVVASGTHWRLSPQGYWYYGPFGLLGEYIISDQRVSQIAAPTTAKWLDNTSWQVAAGWVLTGEDASYNGPVVPRHPFNPANGGWGALQLVARYEELNIDSDAFELLSNPRISASSAQAWSVGLNWWLNRNLRVNTSFSHTDFKGGGGAGTTAPANVTRKDENVLFTRVQLAF